MPASRLYSLDQGTKALVRHRRKMASGADSLFEVGGRSLFDESDTTAPAPAPANDDGTSAARRPATQEGWRFLVNVS